MPSSPLINVVVIGAGLAGAGVVDALASKLPKTHRLVVISETEAAFYPIAALRGAVVKGYESNITLPLEPLLGADSRHLLLKGTKVTELRSHSLKIDRHDHGEFPDRVIEFAYAVLAMGSTYPFPCRPPPNGTSEQHVQAQLRELQAQVAEAESILVVGGGPVGIEFATEVGYEYNVKSASGQKKQKKEITLVSSGDRLMAGPFKPMLGDRLQSQAKEMGVRVVLGQKVDTGDLQTGRIEKQSFQIGNGETVEADFLMVAYGNTPNTSLVASAFPSLLDPSGNKRIKVRPTFQVDSSSSNSDDDLSHIFALGDVASLPETQLWYNAQSHVPVVAANILSVISQQRPSKTYSSPSAPLIVVCAGPKGGASQLFFGIVVGAWATAMAKSKTMFIDKFRTLYHAK